MCVNCPGPGLTLDTAAFLRGFERARKQVKDFAMAMKPTLPFSPEGRQFIKLLEIAAGVDGKRVRAIECRVATGEAITFKVELMASEDDVKKAVGECEVTRLGDAFVEHVPCP